MTNSSLTFKEYSETSGWIFFQNSQMYQRKIKDSNSNIASNVPMYVGSGWKETEKIDLEIEMSWSKNRNLSHIRESERVIQNE